jgi:hypothetical protein
LRPAAGARLRKALRDALGTTHHEAGTLRMSDDPADGVTDPYGRIHDTANCYVVGPALFPSTGSPNPMLSSVALARRTADRVTSTVLPRPAPFVAAAPFRALFDGTAKSFSAWNRVSPGTSNGFALVDGQIVTYGTGDFGLLYYPLEAFADFTLRAQFRITDPARHNSGIFVRFRDPRLDPTPVIRRRIEQEVNAFAPGAPTDLQLFARNRAWGAVHSGFEVQIDDTAAGDPRRSYHGRQESTVPPLDKNRTGAIYKIPAGDAIPGSSDRDAVLQQYRHGPALRPGTWYELEIEVAGDTYTVDLTDTSTGTRTRTSTFENTDPDRGLARIDGRPAGYIGLQSYAGCTVAFRRISIRG